MRCMFKISRWKHPALKPLLFEVAANFQLGQADPWNSDDLKSGTYKYGIEINTEIMYI